MENGTEIMNTKSNQMSKQHICVAITVPTDNAGTSADTIMTKWGSSMFEAVLEGLIKWASFGNIFRCIFVNKKFYILVEISLKFDPMGQIDNNTALV